MEGHELKELHYITPIANVPSILQRGILSHVRAGRIPHVSVAMEEIQDRRSRVVVPGGRKLHAYANLYICARNPMLYKRLDQRDLLCVLKVSTDVLDLSGVVITDANAGGDYVRFVAAPRGLRIVNRERTFAEYWTDDDPIEYYRKKAAKCAEVLVPDHVDPCYLLGAYVANQEAKMRLDGLGTGLVSEIKGHMFFV